MLSLSSCNSCSSKKKEVQGPPPTDFEKGMTAKDTTAVKELVHQFFAYAKEKNFTEAAGMLYRTTEDSDEPQPLNNDEMAEVKTMLETFPMVDYRIEYIKFSDSEENEVLCYVIMKKAEGTDCAMPELPGNRPYKKGGKVPHPKGRRGCNRCGICANMCPADAIPLSNPKAVDTAKCISCMKCVSACPTGVRSIGMI